MKSPKSPQNPKTLPEPDATSNPEAPFSPTKKPLNPNPKLQNSKTAWGGGGGKKETKKQPFGQFLFGISETSKPKNCALELGA